MRFDRQSRRKIIICVGIVLFLLTTYLLFVHNNQLRQDAHYSTPDIPVEFLQNGYLICRHGDGIWSDFIIEHNHKDKRFSHIGIISVSDDGKVMVVHADTSNRFAVSGKVLREPLSDFLSHSRRIGIFRHRRLDASQLASNACHYLGRPFDWKLDDSDSNAIYCSELLKLAIEETSADETFVKVKCGNQDIIPVDAFIVPEHSEELYEWSIINQKTKNSP